MARSKSHPGLEELGLGIPPYLQPRLFYGGVAASALSSQSR